MATLGTGKMTPQQPSPLGQIGTLTVNLIVSPIHVQPVATLGPEPSTFGAPIMREGFITDTGFLIGLPQHP